MDNWLTDGNEVVSLIRCLCFTPQEDFLILISVIDRVNPRSIVQLEGLHKLKKCNDFIRKGPLLHASFGGASVLTRETQHNIAEEGILKKLIIF
jgi:hypothetical protein